MATSDSDESETVRARASDIIGVLATPFGVIPAIIHLSSENATLRSENAQLKIESTRAKEALMENARFRKMLIFRLESPLELRAAEVLAKDPLPGVRSILIDIGAEQGLAKHMAVINDRGLIGKVFYTSNSNSTVQSLLDRNLGAAVRLANCRANGITRWAGGNLLIVDGIPASTTVRLDEEVITSGLDGIFPAGIMVGKVSSTRKIPESLFLQVLVEPSVNFSRVEEVFAVISKPDSILQP